MLLFVFKLFTLKKLVLMRWFFKNISNLKNMDHFDDYGPCVVLASPGMLQVF